MSVTASLDSSTTSVATPVTAISIKLTHKSYPKDMDVSHLMVAHRKARFSSRALHHLFPFDPTNETLSVSRHFVHYLFLNVKSQAEMMTFLRNKNLFFMELDAYEMASSAIVQTLAFSLLFLVYDLKVG